ncbi:MAG: NADP-dependent malic enzyme [Deltaproteobacteria bacterium]|nr:NADP-dependent malic enzyme [Deltaproteobacteria bacterium]
MIAEDDLVEHAVSIRREDALEFHARGRPGKVEVVPSKPCATQRDLSLAYTPGVAEPCLEIHKDPEASYRYTARGNLVAVVSNGTAVLGLGNLGPLAGKPVMEGKGVLFKRFADIDVFDLEVEAREVDAFCRVVKALEPTFGGINLEDIKAPECFEIEERLRREMSIPVFHDDQHGTAIICGAALLNALELGGKDPSRIRVVVSGAGASALACASFYLSLGVRRENVVLVDTRGVVNEGRSEGMNPYKARWAARTDRRTLAEAMEGADVFLGCSAKGLVTPQMVRSMAKDPAIFALANPDPEITYPEAMAARADALVATGRSDYPNQVNNVLGFPSIFRGALDVRARTINEPMKLAAARALAALAREQVPEAVSRAYGGARFSFGREYLIPKPFDSRVLLYVAPAVAQAAMESGVARERIDLEAYREGLKRRLSRGYEAMSRIHAKARSQPRRIAFAQGGHPRILQAARILMAERVCEPVLLGDEPAIRMLAHQLNLEELTRAQVIDPSRGDPERWAGRLFELRQRRGVTMHAARLAVLDPNVLGTLLLEAGEVDGLITGLTETYAEAIRAPLQIIRTRDGRRAGGVYILAFKHELKFLADCTVMVQPSSEELAQTAVETAELARSFDVTPRVALLSYSSFGSAPGESPARVRRAVEIARRLRPDLEIEGEMQVDAALLPEVRAADYPFARLTGAANVLIFPDLDSANIAYRLLMRLGGAEVIGPVLLNMNKPVSVLPTSSGVDEIVHLAAMTAWRAQESDGER